MSEAEQAADRLGKALRSTIMTAEELERALSLTAKVTAKQVAWTMMRGMEHG